MHRLFVSLVIAASLSLPVAGLIAATGAEAAAAAPMAAPAAMTTTGKVLAVDTKHGTVTLSNKGVFVFGKGSNLSKITVGEWVTITWTLSGSTRDASKIVASKSTGMMM
jgi:hypothetical protein